MAPLWLWVLVAFAAADMIMPFALGGAFSLAAFGALSLPVFGGSHLRLVVLFQLPHPGCFWVEKMLHGSKLIRF